MPCDTFVKQRVPKRKGRVGFKLSLQKSNYPNRDSQFKINVEFGNAFYDYFYGKGGSTGMAYSAYKAFTDFHEKYLLWNYPIRNEAIL